MFFLSRLVSIILLPPGSLILALLAALALLLSGRKRAGRAVAIFALLAFYALSTRAVSDLLLGPLEGRHAAFDASAALLGDPARTYVVVLGGGVIDKSPEEGGKASLMAEPLKRLMYGVRVAKVTGLPLVFAGGRAAADPEGESESDAARRFMAENGINVTIYFEDQSRTTWENARNVARLFHPARVVLVTSAYHMPRSVLSFEKAGMAVIPAPTDYKAAGAMLAAIDFLPTSVAFGNSYKALHEYLGLAEYAFLPAE